VLQVPLSVTHYTSSTRRAKTDYRVIGRSGDPMIGRTKSLARPQFNHLHHESQVPPPGVGHRKMVILSVFIYREAYIVSVQMVTLCRQTISSPFFSVFPGVSFSLLYLSRISHQNFGVRELGPAFSTADSSAVGVAPRRVAASKSGVEPPHSKRKVESPHSEIS
jgi:hypothetical protein